MTVPSRLLAQMLEQTSRVAGSIRFGKLTQYVFVQQLVDYKVALQLHGCVTQFINHHYQ